MSSRGARVVEAGHDLLVSDPPTLMLLHGFTNTGACWAPVLAAGAGLRYRALTPDIRGHGTAGSARPVTLEAVLGDIAALTPGPYELCGYSQGGRIALHAALTPGLVERVSRLVLIGASPGLSDPIERRERQAADERLAVEIGQSSIEEFVQRWAQTPVLAGLAPKIAAEAHRDRLRNTPAGLAAALRGLGTGALPSLWDRLPELGMPVTLIVGERDLKFQEIAGEMARWIPECEVVVVPGVGHAVHLEAPAEVAGLL
jgi:2-succinyl-6-hydroxy-2,4-cyclohexadiene-1-carboxylate synthase